MSGSVGLGRVMLDVPGLQLTAEDRELLSQPHVGGVILGLYGRNFEAVPQLQELVGEIRGCNADLLVAVDQEGGRVQRFRQEFTRLPPMHLFGELYQDDRERAIDLSRQCGWLMASEVLSCGLDFSFAPVLDLFMARSRIIADRAFSELPGAVAKLGGAFIAGMHDAGMKATGKHFPGHGSVAADSHVELPVDSRSLDELMAADLRPFVECAPQLDAIMPGHVLYPRIDGHCAALSRTWLQQVLRERIGFKGVIFSDDLEMAAALGAGGVVERARLALDAGCDMILVCNNRTAAVSTIEWLEGIDHPPSQRLLSMQGRRGVDRNTLLASDRWQSTRDAIGRVCRERGY